MNTEIQTFNFNTASLRTLTDENGDPWFVAKDACSILGLNNVGQASARLDDDEKSSITLNDGTTGTPNKAIVSESGLYSLTLASRKPEAHEFKRWVTHEVLPSIRKYGIYAIETTIDQILADPDFGIRLLTDLKNERAKRIKAENQVKELEPKAKALEDFTNAPDALLVREAAKLLSNAGTPHRREGTARMAQPAQLDVPARRHMVGSLGTRESRTSGHGRVKIARTT